jgi:6,7-dimethyl-8-ribityllumazine synthase
LGFEFGVLGDQVPIPNNAKLKAQNSKRQTQISKPLFAGLGLKSIVRHSMSTDIPPPPEALNEVVHFAIVASEYNRGYVDGLVQFAIDEFRMIAPRAKVSVVRVPGSFEIPIAVQAIARKEKPDAILAFGLIFDGETLHASLIATAVTQALLSIGLDASLPVLHEVLVVKNEVQAEARCLSPKLNRGTEAARATVRIVHTLREILKGG